MELHISKDSERIVRTQVLRGRYASEGEVIEDALRLLERREVAPEPQVCTEAEFDRHLLTLGLLSQLPDTQGDIDDPDDQLVAIKGEPLSETVIRERR